MQDLQCLLELLDSIVYVVEVELTDRILRTFLRLSDRFIVICISFNGSSTLCWSVRLNWLSGLRWLDVESNKRFSKNFTELTPAQRINIVDDIAYPGKTPKHLTQGESFFTLMRNLTATGFFTSKIGIADLDYKGNTPNQWNGVPDEVLKQYGLSYDA